jgi:hypothetical protein
MVWHREGYKFVGRSELLKNGRWSRVLQSKKEDTGCSTEWNAINREQIRSSLGH